MSPGNADRAGVGQSPREETAGDTAVGSLSLGGYGELKRVSVADGYQTLECSRGNGVRRCNCEAESAVFSQMD